MHMATKPIEVHPAVPLLGIGHRTISTIVALAAIWGSATLSSLYAPDMITGSNHEHLQLVMFIVWPLGAVATGMVLLAAAVGRKAAAGPWVVHASLNTVAWCGAALTAVFASPMVTGTDPTTIPVAALIAPIFAMLVTAYSSIYVAGAGSES